MLAFLTLAKRAATEIKSFAGRTRRTRHAKRARFSLEGLERRQLLTIDAAGGLWEGDESSPELVVTVGDAIATEPSGEVDVPIILAGTIGERVVTVHYRTVDGSARADSDYIPIEGAVTLDASNPIQSVRIPLINDSVAEGQSPEEFYLEIVGTGEATLLDDRGTIHILDDDFQRWPSLSIDSGSIEEGDEGTRPFEFRLRLSHASSEVITVPYSLRDSTAIAGEDYVGQSGSVTFAPGETLKTVTVEIIGDTTAEIDENFQLVMDPNTSGVRVDSWSGWATILNDDRFEIPDLHLEAYESEAELENWLLERAVQQYQHLFGSTTNWPGGWWWGPYPVNFDGAEGAPPTGQGSERSHSETNVQEAGVDEGDIVETDGDFIYVISQNELLIFNALPADDMQLVSRTLLQETPSEMYLDGDRLTIVSSGFNYYAEPWTLGPFVDFAGPIFWPGGNANSTATVFDISDRASPEIIQKVELDGSVQSSRMIEGQLHLIMQNYLDFPQPLFYEIDPTTGEPGTEPVNPDEIVWDGSTEYQYETEASYRARLQDAIADEALPSFTARGADPDDPNMITGLVSEATEIYKPLAPDEQNLISVVTIDTRSGGPADIESASIFNSNATTTYVSSSSIYLVTPYWPRWDVRGWAGEWSAILKFEITGNGTDLTATGGVNGRVLNQFSLGEHDGHLRIATTERWGTAARNNVYVLGQDGDDLVLTGAIENIAPGESIFSARFIGDRGYVVTFRRVDPLFTLDLSDPNDPQVAAELKLPGFSEYLQPLSEEYLLGIGRDADPETGIARGVQITLFNVGDIANPVVADQFTFEDQQWWNWTPAAYEHHSVGYYPEYDTLAMPITSGAFEVPVDWDNDGQADYTYMQPRSALWVFDIDLDIAQPDIEVRDTIVHDSGMQRSVRVNDVLYAISYGAISSHNIDEPGDALAEVAFMQNWVGMQIDPENRDGDNLLILGSGRREEVALTPTVGGQFQVTLNGEMRGEFSAESVSQVIADGMAGPDRIMLNGRSQLPANVRLNNLTPFLAGDFDGNGRVNLEDFNILKSQFGEAVDDALFDVDSDGIYGLGEFNAMKANFGQSTSDSLAASTESPIGGNGSATVNAGMLRFALAVDAALADE